MTSKPEGDIQSPIGPFHVHAHHPFEGFEIVDSNRGPGRLHGLCSCGVVLDTADAAFRACPQCGDGSGATSARARGHPPGCSRCGGSGRVIDHAALHWKVGAKEETHDGD